MTPEEQAPVRCAAETSTRWPDYKTYRCTLPKGHPRSHEHMPFIEWTDGDCWWPEAGQTAPVPAPEETVETPDERFLFAVCSICGARIPTRADYVAHQGAHPADSPAPEPAGEAEGPLYFNLMCEQGHKYRSPQPKCPVCAPSSGAPRTQVTQGGMRSKDGQWWWSWHRGAFREGAWIPDEVAAAIAAEASAPLAQALSALRWAYDHNVDQLGAAERKLEEAKAWADDLCWQQMPGGRCNTARSHTIHDGYCYGCDSDVPHSHHMFWPKEATEEYWAERALTPPASTAVEETTDA